MGESADGKELAQAGISATSSPPPMPPLREHAVYLFYPIRVPAGRELREIWVTLQDQLARSPSRSPEVSPQAMAAGHGLPWLHPAERDALTVAGRSTPIWEPAPMDVGTDLHAHVRRMLGRASGRAASGRANANALTFRLAELPRKLLQGKSLLRQESFTAGAPESAGGGGRRRLVATFGAAARARVSAHLGFPAPTALEVRIQQVRLVVFRTGYGVILVEIALSNLDDTPLNPYWLVEGVGSLARHNNLRWLDADESLTTDSHRDSFTLGDIVSSLHASEDIGGTARRVFTAAYAQFSSAPEPGVRRRYAIQLARHYSDHYRIAGAIEGVEEVADFDSVTHAMALEGTATIVDLSPPTSWLSVPEFLTQFKTATFERHYLPIKLLAFHEFIALLQLSNEAKFWAGKEGGEEEDFTHWAQQVDFSVEGVRARATTTVLGREDAYARLERLRDEVLRFRLCFRFSHVSYVSMHNAVYEAMRRAWSLERMQADLAHDTAEIGTFLESVISRANARSVRIFGVGGAMGLALISSYTLYEKVMPLLSGMSDGKLKFAHVGAWIVVALITASAGLVTWVKTRMPSQEHEEGLSAHAIDEAVLQSLDGNKHALPRETS